MRVGRMVGGRRGVGRWRRNGRGVLGLDVAVGELALQEVEKDFS